MQFFLGVGVGWGLGAGGGDGVGGRVTFKADFFEVSIKILGIFRIFKN